jgi:hypothetical protein
VYVNAPADVARRIGDTIAGDNGAMNVDIIGPSPRKIDGTATYNKTSKRKSPVKGKISIHQEDSIPMRAV